MGHRMLSQVEINKLSDEEFADYLEELAELDQHETPRAGNSPIFEITQETHGNDVDPTTNHRQELTSGDGMKIELKMYLEYRMQLIQFNT